MLTYSKYPFVVNYREYLSRVYGYQVTLSDLEGDNKVVELARRRLKDAIEKGEVEVFNAPAEDEVASFYLSLAAAAAAGSRRLLEIYAEAESKRALRLLRDEDDSGILELGKAMGLSVTRDIIKIPWIQARNGKVTYRLLSYSVSVSNYLRVVSPPPEPKWSLVNSMVRGGRVYMDSETLREFLALAVKRLIIGSADKLVKEDEPPRFLAEEALRLLNAKESKVMDSKGFSSDLFPPCIRQLQERLDKLSDEELYVYLSFLASIGLPPGTMALELSRARAVRLDVAERSIRALITAGLGTTYKPYSCKVMKDKGLCPAQCGLPHPILVYRANLKRPQASQQAQRA